MNEKRFWSILDDAWTHAPIGKRSSERAREFLLRLEMLLAKLRRRELAAWDDLFVTKMFELDSEILSRVAAAVDHDFVEARAFTIALGRTHFEAVLADPSRYVDGRLDRILYLATNVHEARFEVSLRPSSVSWETGANRDKWPSRKERFGAEQRGEAVAE